MEECFSEDRKMEIEALQSIYGELFTTFEGGDQDEIFQYEVNLMQSDIKIIFTIPGNSAFSAKNTSQNGNQTFLSFLRSG